MADMKRNEQPDETLLQSNPRESSNNLFQEGKASPTTWERIREFEIIGFGWGESKTDWASPISSNWYKKQWHWRIRISNLPHPWSNWLELQISNLERELSDPVFWEDSNSQRNQYINSQLSLNLRLLERLKQWEEWRGDSLVAMEMSHDDSVSDDERDLFYDECLLQRQGSSRG